MKRKETEVTIGADPEVFIIDNDGGLVVPTTETLGFPLGTKDNPQSFNIPLATSKCHQHQVLRDNLMVEFNWKPSTKLGTVQMASEQAAMGLTTLLGPRGYIVWPGSSIKVPQSILVREEAKEFGCKPDFDAYEQGRRREAIKPDSLGEYRHAGGHIHIGYYNTEIVPSWVAALMCDLFIGLPMLYSNYDKQTVRRPLYGLAGLHRPTTYGVEYRSLSNYWFVAQINHQYTPAAMAFRQAKLVGSLCKNELSRVVKLYEVVDWRAVRDAINNENVHAAKRLYNEVSRISL